MTIDPKQLRALAEKATQDVEADWRYIDGPLMGDVCVDLKPSGKSVTFRYIKVGTGAVGPFIAACSPSAVIALLDEVDRLRKESEEQRTGLRVAWREHTAVAGTVQAHRDATAYHFQVRNDIEAQLSAALAAKDEACLIADSLAAVLDLKTKKPETIARISALRDVGRK